MSKFYITTAIPYVNAAPHIGFALEIIQADSLARYHRLKGYDTFFLTGTDEHGVKLYETAKEAGMDTQEFADMNAEKFLGLKKVLNLSNDDFIRTTSDKHKKGAQKLWMKLVEKGDIYKGSYKGKYCAGCESFVPDKNITEDGKCPVHKKPLKDLEEENYFFKLSKYSDQVKKLIETDEYKIVPESRKKEMLNIIGEEGLRDISFSRPKDVLPWGVDVPNDDTQVMYVWCDALSNYITGIDYGEDGERFERYWPADVHVIGKDILRFHAGYWPAMLLAGEVELPKKLYVHGFITSEGEKMSKSLGNVVDPLEYVDKYGADALRWFLMREIPTTDDGDFSHTRFLEVYNSELANNLGNLVNRVVMMVEKYLGGKIPEKVEGGAFEGQLKDFIVAYSDAFERFDLKVTCETLISLMDFGNKYIDDKKPWILAKEGGEGLAEIFYNLLELTKLLAGLALPLIPEAAEKIVDQIGIDIKDLSLELKWGELKEGGIVKKGEVLFPRIDE